MAQKIDLNIGESVLVEVKHSPLWTWFLYVITLGLWEIWRQQNKFIVTNQRLIHVHGIINQSKDILPLAKVQYIRSTAGILGLSNVRLGTAGSGFLSSERISLITRADSLSLSAAIQANSVI